jgi:hypothetical protein
MNRTLTKLSTPGGGTAMIDAARVIAVVPATDQAGSPRLGMSVVFLEQMGPVAVAGVPDGIAKTLGLHQDEPAPKGPTLFKGD